MKENPPPDAGVAEKLKNYSDRMTISQVVVFFKRHGFDVTKTMIQNYVRVSVLPPPVEKRRYTKDHVLTILLIDHLKKIYSLEEIRLLLGPIAEGASDTTGPGMSGAYRDFYEQYKVKIESLENEKPPGLSVAAESVACRRHILKSNDAPKPEI